jgi:chorismate mutase
MTDAYRQELENIANARRFDKSQFLSDEEFADWAQSRARYALRVAQYKQSAGDDGGIEG